MEIDGTEYNIYYIYSPSGALPPLLNEEGCQFHVDTYGLFFLFYHVLSLQFFIDFFLPEGLASNSILSALSFVSLSCEENYFQNGVSVYNIWFQVSFFNLYFLVFFIY